MKLVSFEADGTARVGALTEDGKHMVDLQAAHVALNGRPYQPLRTMLSLIEDGEAGLEAARANLAAGMAGQVPGAVSPLSDIRLLAPIPAPPQMRDAMSFEKHLKQALERGLLAKAARADDPAAAEAELRASGAFEVPDVWYRQPLYYKANRFAVTGPDTDVIWPAYSRIMDYEMEFGIYIAKFARDVPKEAARDYIFGYTVFNDFSARDAQKPEMQGTLGPAKGKDFDRANAMGPCIVTADEFGDPYERDMIVRINGEEVSRGNSGEMHWKFEDLIAHISRGETLHPGEFIGSGTVGGGCGLERGEFLEHGDVIELEVDGIGILRNRVLRGDG